MGENIETERWEYGDMEIETQSERQDGKMGK